MLYEIKNLVKSFNGRAVLDIDAFSLKRGKVVGLLGPNGAGKTTLLEILAFLSQPNSGKIRYCGEPVDYGIRSMKRLRRKVVLVQQLPILFSTSVQKNVEFPLSVRKTPKKERERIVQGLLELVGMLAFRNARADRLSAGETHRVAIACALACLPEVILLDEPTASVDVENQAVIERIIRDINHNKGISVVFTSHNMHQTSRLADETWFLLEGKVKKSVYENIFSGHVEGYENGSRLFVIPGGLQLEVMTERSGRVRISIDPAGLSIVPVGTKTRKNVLKGRLVQLTEETDRVRALVDVGIPLNVLIAKEQFGRLGLCIGKEVHVLCPAESIDVFF